VRVCHAHALFTFSNKYCIDLLVRTWDGGGKEGGKAGAAPGSAVRPHLALDCVWQEEDVSFPGTLLAPGPLHLLFAGDTALEGVSRIQERWAHGERGLTGWEEGARQRGMSSGIDVEEQ
jgi:hypothetical protein